LSEFEELLEKIREQKPELTKEDIDDKIKQKKEKIGVGYLTDQGALFLIASDLGISLKQTLKVEMGLKDIYVGAKDVSIESRVLNISPTKQFSRKDGSPFLLRTMTVYDNDSTASVKLWDEKANLPGIEELKPGDLIKIIKAYVKSDLNGSPTINVGSGSNIESTNKESKKIEKILKTTCLDKRYSTLLFSMCLLKALSISFALPFFSENLTTLEYSSISIINPVLFSIE